MVYILVLTKLDIKIANYDVKLHNRKILRINIEEFKQEYKEYIDEMKKIAKKSNNVKEELAKEFLKKEYYRKYLI